MKTTKKKPLLLAKGVFGWDGSERRTDRYGSLHLCSSPYDQGVVAVVQYDTSLLERMNEKRVRVTCVVIKTRKSGHLGDLTHGFFPTTPDRGEIVDLGVGILGHETGWDGAPNIILYPRDGRPTFWMDPKKMFRLHDQTVEVYIEATRAAFSPVHYVAKSGKEEVHFVEPDKAGNNVQVKTTSRVDQVVIPPPKIEPLGGGLYRISGYKTGDRVSLGSKQ